MTRGQMRTKLRRRIQDEVGDSAGGWTDAELNAELNEAYAWVQKEIVKVLPEAHLFWDYMNTVAGTNWYPLPQTFGVSELSMKPTAGSTYTKLEPKIYQDIVALTTVTTTRAGVPYYTIRGQWIGIFPAPDVSVTSGLQLVHTPIMAMSADDDLPRIKLPLHEAVLLKAKDSIMGDLEQDAPANRQKLSDIINDIPMWYDARSDTPDRFTPRGL